MNKNLYLILVVALAVAAILLSGCIRPPVCGNGICEKGENHYNCPIEEGGDCKAPEMHMECVTGQCVEVQGPGTDQCQENNDCITCYNECPQEGLKQCSDNGYRTCGNYDSDSCLEWSSVTACPEETTCQNGECIPTEDEIERAFEYLQEKKGEILSTDPDFLSLIDAQASDLETFRQNIIETEEGFALEESWDTITLYYQDSPTSGETIPFKRSIFIQKNLDAIIPRKAYDISTIIILRQGIRWYYIGSINTFEIPSIDYYDLGQANIKFYPLSDKVSRFKLMRYGDIVREDTGVDWLAELQNQLNIVEQELTTAIPSINFSFEVDSSMIGELADLEAKTDENYSNYRARLLDYFPVGENVETVEQDDEDELYRHVTAVSSQDEVMRFFISDTRLGEPSMGCMILGFADITSVCWGMSYGDMVISRAAQGSVIKFLGGSPSEDHTLIYYDQNILIGNQVHESGHVFGLKHNPIHDSIMSPGRPKGLYTFSDRDKYMLWRIANNGERIDEFENETDLEKMLERIFTTNSWAEGFLPNLNKFDSFTKSNIKFNKEYVSSDYDETTPTGDYTRIIYNTQNNNLNNVFIEMPDNQNGKVFDIDLNFHTAISKAIFREGFKIQ
ncbi:MAG: hypothetical protein ABIE23_01730 [archaeon]